MMESSSSTLPSDIESQRMRIQNLIAELDKETEQVFQSLITIAERFELETGGKRYSVVMSSNLIKGRNLAAETYSYAVQCRSIEKHLRARYLRNRINIIDELRRLIVAGYCDRSDGRRGSIIIHPRIVDELRSIVDG